MFDGFMRDLCAGAHYDDDALSVRRANVVEQVILAADNFGEAVHHRLYLRGSGVVVGVGSFANLEEDIGILRRAAQHGVIGRERALAMLDDAVHVEERAHVVFVEHLDLVDFMRSAEAIEKVQEGNAGFEGRGMRDQGEVHGFLHRVGAEHGPAGGAAEHDVGVTARTIATHALSIFGDHSDVMFCRTTGWAMLCSNSVQEAMDLALIAHAATLETRIPFLHFFDGFRTSHEVNKIEMLAEDDVRALLNMDRIIEHRQRALSPDRPVLRGTAQNPDVFFQIRESANAYYDACPAKVQAAMNQFADVVGRSYHLFDYVGAPDAEHVIVMMGSGAEAAHETVDYLNARGEKLGLLKVRLYRPFCVKSFMEALPASVRKISVLDRTKESGAIGEPLFLDVVGALNEGLKLGYGTLKNAPSVVGGRYGLSSKEFTPAMVRAVYYNLKQDQPKDHFTIGINDDVTHTSLNYDAAFSTEPDNVVRAMFYGLGADGTVGANKNSIKIIGENTDNYAQGYFVYDSKKSGAMTVSHLRFGPQPIKSSYLVSKANFVACHQ